MSLGITHFSAGASFTSVFILLVGWNVIYPFSIAILGGVWAMIPDMAKLHPIFKWLHDPFWTNIFWGHWLLDKLDPDTARVGAVFVGFLLITVMMFWGIGLAR